MRSLLLFLSLTLAAACQQSPRDWMVTMDDLRSHWPTHYRLRPTDEKVEGRTILTTSIFKYHYLDRKKRIFVFGTLTKSSGLRAEMGYGAFNWATHFDGDTPQTAVDFSKQIKAGEVSQCRQVRNSDVWMFAYRQKRVWGYLMIGGMKLTPKEMAHEVKVWAARVEALQRTKKSQSKGLWPFQKKN